MFAHELPCAKKVSSALQENLVTVINSLAELTECCIYRTNRSVSFNSKHGNVYYVTEETHHTRETELWQGDEVQILWDTDVFCR